MGNLTRYTAADLPALMERINKNSIGMDEYFDRLFALHETTKNYPPFNLVTVSNVESKLELALAGFKKKEVISLSREEALRLGHDYIGTEHLLLGVIREGEGIAISLLKKLGISLDDLRASIEHNTKGSSSSNLKNLSNIPLTRQSEKVLKITYLEAKIFKSQLIGTEHLLLSILRDEDNIATQILEKFDVNYDIVKELLEYQSNKYYPI